MRKGSKGQHPKVQKSKTVTRDQVPEWCSENSYIIHGYRKVQHSYLGCYESLFYLHNETGNVYTHLIGAFGFLAIWIMTFSFYLPIMASTGLMDYFVHTIFMFGAMTCLALSTTYHLCCCHSYDIARKWNKLGIVVMIIASFFPSVYYGFYCQPHLQAFYLSAISVLGSLTIWVAASNVFLTPQYMFFRTSLFLLLGFFGVFPLLHSIFLYGFEFVQYGMGSNYIIIMGIVYVIGATFYVGRFPERWYPGAFDIWFHSHQIHHICVLVASICHWMGHQVAHSFWHTLMNKMGPEDLCAAPSGSLVSIYLNKK